MAATLLWFLASIFILIAFREGWRWWKLRDSQEHRDLTEALTQAAWCGRSLRYEPYRLHCLLSASLVIFLLTGGWMLW
jgi:hypothetical protein